MMDTSQKTEQKNQLDSSQSSSILIGVYLSSMSFLLLFILVFAETSIEIQQVIVVSIGLLLLGSFSAFKKVIDVNEKSSSLEQYVPYFDNKIVNNTTNNIDTHYHKDVFYNKKQNLADAAQEIQNLLEKLSKNYDESPTDRSSIDVNLLKKIEIIEEEKQEELTEKETIITAQAIQEIEQNPNLKQRFIEAMKAATIAASSEAFKTMSSNPIVGISLAFLNEFSDSEN